MPPAGQRLASRADRPIVTPRSPLEATIDLSGPHEIVAGVFSGSLPATPRATSSTPTTSPASVGPPEMNRIARCRTARTRHRGRCAARRARTSARPRRASSCSAQSRSYPSMAGPHGRAGLVEPHVARRRRARALPLVGGHPPPVGLLHPVSQILQRRVGAIRPVQRHEPKREAVLQVGRDACREQASTRSATSRCPRSMPTPPSRRSSFRELTARHRHHHIVGKHRREAGDHIGLRARRGERAIGGEQLIDSGLRRIGRGQEKRNCQRQKRAAAQGVCMFVISSEFARAAAAVTTGAVHRDRAGFARYALDAASSLTGVTLSGSIRPSGR